MIKAKVLFAEQFFLEMPKASLWSSVRMGLQGSSTVVAMSRIAQERRS